MKTILDENKSELALIVGNGINRYGSSKSTNSWESLLLQLAKIYLPSPLRKRPEGVSLTEFYDVLELKAPNSKSAEPLQQQFCDLMAAWKPFEHHKRIVNWAVTNCSPVLTTNFESVLADAGGFKRHRTVKGGFTAYYPWETYFGSGPIGNPCMEFGIWHINGMEHYRQSIRLGLSHYMGSVQRARAWLHRGGDRRLFSGASHDTWKGSKTWLHVIFSSPLLVFGLGLEENEVFLRWLLIERARYFRKFPSRQREAWYVRAKPISDFGKKFFLDGVGVQTVVVAGYDEMYSKRVWDDG